MLAWCNRGGNCLEEISVCRKNNLKVDVKNECCVADSVLTDCHGFGNERSGDGGCGASGGGGGH
jgi:hypothetical protein